MQRSEGFFEGFQEAKLFFQIWRPARPKGLVVITHGHGEHSDSYHRLIGALQDLDLAFLAWDLRGHGRSEGQRGFVHQFEDYARDFEALWSQVLPALKIQGPRFFFAHSMGVLVQMKALAGLMEGPEQVQIWGSPFLEAAIRVPLAKDIAAIAFRDLLPHLTLATGVQDEDCSRDSAVLQEYARDPLRHSKMSAGAYLGAQETQKFLLAKPEIWKGPVLLLVSDDDPIVRTATNLRFFEELRAENKACEVFAGMKHELVNDIGREHVFEKIRGFLSTLLEGIPGE